MDKQEKADRQKRKHESLGNKLEKQLKQALEKARRRAGLGKST